MKEYEVLSTEEERSLFLRNEMKHYNIQLVDAAKNAELLLLHDFFK